MTVKPEDFDINNFPKIRNRDEARAFSKILRKSGNTKEKADKIVKLTKDMTAAWDSESKTKAKEFLLEGEKVKFNIDKMWAHPDWNSKQEAYKDFVVSNIDTIFTVTYDEKFKDKPSLVRFVEDDSEQQWQFSDVDLLVLDASDGKFKEMWMIEEGINKE